MPACGGLWSFYSTDEGATIASFSTTVAATDSEDNQLQLVMKSWGVMNKLTNSVTLCDGKNSVVDLLQNSHAIVAGRLGLLTLTLSIRCHHCRYLNREEKIRM